MNKLLSRSIGALPVLAALYLVCFNVTLNLPTTRAFLNTLQPEQFRVTWKRAWSLYPLRVELDGVSADGQTPTEQWQVDARRAAASVSLLPLLRGEIRVHDLDLEDIDLRLRPRPPADGSRDALTEFFPVIRDRDPDAAAEAAPEDTSGTLVLEIDDIQVRGEHSFWVSHIRGSTPGAVRGSFRMETATGRLALAGGALDLTLTSLTIGPKEAVTDAAAIAGTIDIPPFIVSETNGLEMMRVPELDARIDLPVQNLDFLALLMPLLDEIGLNGRGRLRGRLVLSAGEILGGTDLVVEAHALAMDLGRYDFSGDGTIELKVDPQDEAQADLLVRFEQVLAELEADSAAGSDDAQVLFTGRGLTARLHAAEVDPTTTSTAERVQDLVSEVELGFKLDIPSMEAPDLAVYSRLFPEDWDLALLGGTGTVAGALEASGDRLSLNLDLASEEADLRYRDYQANADLLLRLRARIDDGSTASLRLDGTELRIEDARLAVKHGEGKTRHPSERHLSSKPWRAHIKISESALRLLVSPGHADSDPIPAIAETLQDKGFGAVLAGADGRLSAVLSVSELDWIAELLERPLGLSLAGTGELDTEIVLTNGRAEKGTTLNMPRERLSLAILEHRVDGMGTASLRMEQGGKRPRFRLDLALDDARLRRRDEPEPSIGEVRLDAEIVMTDTLAHGGDSADINLTLHSARVRDMSIYNAYLPPSTPLSLVSGGATLAGDLRFSPNRAEGQLLLEGEDIRVKWDRQELSGDLRVDLLVRDGAAKDLRFDITGSSVMLKGFRVAGESGSTSAPDWHARLQLDETQVRWHKPMHLTTQAYVTVKNTRPFVDLLDSVRGKHEWIDNLLTLENLAGHLRLAVDADNAIIEDAMLGASELGIHAKGRSAPSAREAMLLLRWHNLSGTMELQNGQKHFDIVDAPARFAAYRPGKTPLSELGTEHTVPKETSGTQPSSGAMAHDRTPFDDGDRDGPATRTPRSRDHRPGSTQNPFLDHSL
ncbi:hypothetical protein [Thiocapsa bogorovii]|uniref:hypothetical protein n=1 Tax=Thiocapsa bogorovii TaxID=521689 RepID=UPI001E386F68|nr:hypothetical protein [Thiocapsa bogorovii]UHD17876.1 hypothetical protein LT988_07460 [Thiocapsa bogorovii]